MASAVSASRRRCRAASCLSQLGQPTLLEARARSCFSVSLACSSTSYSLQVQHAARRSDTRLRLRIELRFRNGVMQKCQTWRGKANTSKQVTRLPLAYGSSLLCSGPLQRKGRRLGLPERALELPPASLVLDQLHSRLRLRRRRRSSWHRRVYEGSVLHQRWRQQAVRLQRCIVQAALQLPSCAVPRLRHGKSPHVAALQLLGFEAALQPAAPPAQLQQCRSHSCSNEGQRLQTAGWLAVKVTARVQLHARRRTGSDAQLRKERCARERVGTGKAKDPTRAKGQRARALPRSTHTVCRRHRTSAA